ncbi:MAG TPA: tetratricopeptide repeat protein [Thermoanaerobaculia bacterium]|nr:tetratricopeptide repeat protein [Thermoanaerobaculia bacterium]
MKRSTTVVASDPIDGAWSGSLEPGEVLAGRYRIVAFLGRGAVGEVYEAFDQELGDAVAVKILRPEIARDERVLQRFKREIQLARRVTHPNVCRVFDLVYHISTHAGEAGPPPEKVLLTMELLRGETLEQLLARQGRMTLAEALPVIGHVVAALSAAHANGVVHRDLKSGNIFLVPSSSGTRAVVTDFGLAWSSIEADDSANLTATGELVGSPAYMAPEQVRGEEATPATDVYALGVVMFEMVTGELPFVGKSAFYTALKRLQEPAPSPRIHLSDLDPAWEKTILRCLEREPAKRFPSVRHVLHALGLTKAEEDATSPVRLIESHVRRLRRRRRRIFELGLAAAVLALGGFWWVWQTGHLGHRAARAATAQTLMQPGPAVALRPVVAVLPFDSLAGKDDHAGRAAFELLPLELAASGNLRVVPAEEVDQALRDLATADSARPSDSHLLKRLGADFLVTGAYLPGPAGTRWDVVLRDRSGTKAFSATGDDALESLAGKLRQAMGASALTVGDAQALGSLRPEPEAVALWAEGLERLRRDEAPAARDLLRRAVAADADNPLLHSALAGAWQALGYAGEARLEARLAFSLATALRQEDRLALQARYHEAGDEWGEAAARWQDVATAFPDDVEAVLHQAAALTEAGKSSEAEEALARLGKLPASARNDPRVDLAVATAAVARSDFGRARTIADRAAGKAEALGARRLAAQARLEKAWALLGLHDLAGASEEAQSVRRDFVSVADPRSAAEVDRTLGMIRGQAGDMDGARTAYASALAVYQRLAADGEAEKTLREEGNVHYAAHDLDRAETFYRQGRALAARLRDRRGDAAMAHNLANIVLQKGRLAEAKDLFHQVLTLHRDLGYADGEAATLQGLAQIALFEGQLLEAQGDYQQALAIYRQKDRSRNAAEVLNNLAEVSLELGDLAKSQRQREEARDLSKAAGQEDGVARATRGIADVVRERGDAAAARALYEQSLATYERLKLPGKQAEILDEIGVTLTLEGDLTEALKHFRQALEITRQRHDRGAEAQVLMHRGRALWRWGQLSEASASLQQALAALRELRQEPNLAEALVSLGGVQRDSGDLAAARRSLEQALAISRRRGARGAVAAAQAGLGSLDLSQGALATARKRQAEALAIRTDLGARLATAESRLALAEVTLAENRPAQAEADARAAAAELHALANPPGECTAALLLTRCLLAQNKTAQAGEVLAGAAKLLDASQEPAVRKAAGELRTRTVKPTAAGAGP